MINILLDYTKLGVQFTFGECDCKHSLNCGSEGRMKITMTFTANKNIVIMNSCVDREMARKHPEQVDDEISLVLNDLWKKIENEF